LTLVEVVVALALLGSLLVAILIAEGKLRKQARRAEITLEACQVADGLLEAWWQNLSEFPRNESGTVETHPEWAWETQVQDNSSAEELDAAIVALEIYPQEDRFTPLVRVEVLLPSKERP
jgi:type II secretory pathway pseudopilin PulG